MLELGLEGGAGGEADFADGGAGPNGQETVGSMLW